MSHYPRLIIAGTHSGIGKTTVTVALLAAFTARGRIVQSFKAGPDFSIVEGMMGSSTAVHRSVNWAARRSWRSSWKPRCCS